MQFKKCAIDGCSGNSYWKAFGALGMCNAHYRRNRRHGDPNAGGRRQGAINEWVDNLLDEDPDHCVEWPFSRGSNGYGNWNYRGRNIVAHRYICIRVNGEPYDDALQAAHSCGRGASGCVTPKHLSWKTAKENAQDRDLHGTRIYGERHPHTKLKDSDVLNIRKDTRLLKVISAEYGVSESCISTIRNGLSRKDAK